MARGSMLFSLVAIIGQALLLPTNVFADSVPRIMPAAEQHPLIVIEQHRSSVVQRIVRDWTDPLATLPGARGLTPKQLGDALIGLRSDRLLAASLAGSFATIELILAEDRAERLGVRRVAAKSLGEPSADLTYTPVTPCRLADTRVAIGFVGADTSRDFKVWVASGGFTAQGGDVGNCNVPENPAAVTLNITAVNMNGPGNLIAYPTGGAEPNTSVLNYQGGIFALSNGAIVPVCVPNCPNQLTIKTNGAGVDLVIDVVGYFKAPGDATGLDITVAGQRAMRYEANAISPNVIGGSPANDVAPGVRGATIAGGGVPSGNTDPNFVAEAPNRVTDAYGTVGGGYANRAGNDTGVTIDAAFATVAGGIGNTASGVDSTVAGGGVNTASGPFSTISGGVENQAVNNYATVAGGQGNIASGQWSFTSGFTNLAAGSYSFATGANNTISAGGTGSVVLGQNANATHAGCFVFGDSYSLNDRVVTDCGGGDNQVVMRADGGYFLYSIGSGAFGAQLLHGSSSWTTFSDRNGKEHIRPTDPRLVLATLVAVPVSTWNWKSQEASIRHMGPMAQDFYAAFGLGETDRGINTVDGQGVALAAIQGLNAKVEERLAAKDAEIGTLREEVAELRRALEVLISRATPEGRVAQAR